MAAHQLEEVLAGMMGCSSNKNNIDQQLEEKEEEEKKGMSRPPSLERALKCPRCDSTNTKFCYYNNYSLSQPRYLCKGCRRYWTQGGSLRNIPVGGRCRKDKRSPSSKKAHERRRHTHQSLAASAAAANNSNPNPSLNSSAGAGILSILRGGGGGFLDRHSNRKNRYDDNASDYADARGGNSMMRSSLEGGNISVGNETLTAGAEGYSWTNHGNNVAVESTREYYWIDGVSSYWYGLDHQ